MGSAAYAVAPVLLAFTEYGGTGWLAFATLCCGTALGSRHLVEPVLMDVMDFSGGCYSSC